MNEESFEIFELLLHLRCMRRLQKIEYEFVGRTPDLIHQEKKVDESLSKIQKRIDSALTGNKKD